MGELGLIAWIRERAMASDEVEVGSGDDVAVLRIGAERVAFATDVVVAGTHFAAETPGRAVGWKALAANISDLAATGSKPVACVGSVSLGDPGGDEFARELYLGLAECGEAYGCPVVGGDVAGCNGPTSVAVAVIGRFEAEPVLRSGAGPGQVIYVTGDLGGSILGSHLSFRPRLEHGLWLAGAGLATAMIDVSDGLATDLGHLAKESGVGAVIDEGKLPVSGAARELARTTGRAPVDHALSDGEDFELLFTARAEDADEIESRWPEGVRLSRIGETTAAGGIMLRGDDGSTRPMTMKGFEHGLGGDE